MYRPYDLCFYLYTKFAKEKFGQFYLKNKISLDLVIPNIIVNTMDLIELKHHIYTSDTSYLKVKVKKKKK